MTGVNAGGEPLVAYWWTSNVVSYQISVNPEGHLTSGLVEDLMLAILVPPGPTGEEQTATLERECAEMMPFPVPDTFAVTDWAGPDFWVQRSKAIERTVADVGLDCGGTRHSPCRCADHLPPDALGARRNGWVVREAGKRDPEHDALERTADVLTVFALVHRVKFAVRVV